VSLINGLLKALLTLERFMTVAMSNLRPVQNDKKGFFGITCHDSFIDTQPTHFLLDSFY
jgi:hypothetical protein